MLDANCVAPADLERLFRGSLPEDEAADMEDHVLHCTACLEKLKTLADTEDSLAGLLRQHTPGPDFTSSSVLADLMKQLKSLCPSSITSVRQGAAMLALICTKCRKKLTVQDTSIGKKVKCPGCGQVITVPTPAAVPASDRRLPPDPQPSSQAPAPASGNRPTPSAVNALEATIDVKPADRDPTATAIPLPTGQGKEAGNSGDGVNLTHFLSPPQAGDELGRLGKYRILKILGHGGMGVVYKAEDPLLKRAVAIKAMLPGMAANASAGKRFLREAQTMAAVENDYIVRILDVSEDRGVPFLAMEFLKGEPLDVRLERDKTLPPREVARIGREIAEGLQAAHERGLIHRDIKPGNIWLEAARSRVKILDFGLARTAEPESNLTQQGAIIGTPAYMAPEQGRGDPVDARSDLFSLGVVLYRLCSGKQPFQRVDAISTLMAVAMDNPPPPVQLHPELPPELSELVMALLQKDPDRRPASAAVVVEMLHALEAKLGGASGRDDRTVSLPSPAKGKAAPANRRRRRLLVGIAAGLALLIGGLLAAQIIVQIRDKNGKVVGELAVPEGGEVRLIQAKQDKAAPRPGKDGEWVSLFNGKDLDGWEGKEDVWRVKDGTIFATSFPDGRKLNTFLCSKQQLTDFELEFDVRLRGTNNSGVMIRSDLYDTTNYWLRGIKCDLGVRSGWGSLVTYDGTNGDWLKAVKDSAARWKIKEDADAFNHVSIRCVGKKITVRINGEPGMESEIAQLAESGRIAFQLRYGEPSEISLKNIRVRKIETAGDPPSQGQAAAPIDDAWYKHVAALPADKQVEAVVAKLKERNPGFDGKVTPKIEGSVVTEVRFSPAGVTDLSPVRALAGLKVLNFGGRYGANLGGPADLSPLKDMKLTSLSCDFTPVSDLSPLKDMKLTELAFCGTKVADLSPLKGMPLTVLGCSYTPVSELSPLKGMPLTALFCNGVKVSDLSPLKGMPLTVLACEATKVTDLSPLKGMPLTGLSCWGTPVSDLSPLKDMKLTGLDCRGTPVPDLSPLKGMPLTELKCDFKPERDADILRCVKTLEKINDKPAAQFWKEVDAKAANKNP